MFDEPAALAVLGEKGVSLSSLLAGVSRAVAQACKAGVWTLVEVVELRANGGQVYHEVSERDTHGVVLAKVRAVIWQSTASAILPAFEQAIPFPNINTGFIKTTAPPMAKRCANWRRLFALSSRQSSW